AAPDGRRQTGQQDAVPRGSAAGRHLRNRGPRRRAPRAGAGDYLPDRAVPVWPRSDRLARHQGQLPAADARADQLRKRVHAGETRAGRERSRRRHAELSAASSFYLLAAAAKPAWRQASYTTTATEFPR